MSQTKQEREERYADYEAKIKLIIMHLEYAENIAKLQDVDQDELVSSEFTGTTIQDLIVMVIDELRDHLFQMHKQDVEGR